MVGGAPAGINIFTYPLVQRGWPQFNDRWGMQTADVWDSPHWPLDSLQS